MVQGEIVGESQELIFILMSWVMQMQTMLLPAEVWIPMKKMIGQFLAIPPCLQIALPPLLAPLQKLHELCFIT